MSLSNVKAAVAKARESIGTANRISVGALMVAAVALLVSMIALPRLGRLARA